MDKNKGRTKDVIIEVLPRTVTTDPFGGSMTLEYDRLLVWADAGLKIPFETIEGVIKVVASDFNSRYIIAIDPRYETDYVKREVEAVAQIYDTRTGWKQTGVSEWNPRWFDAGSGIYLRNGKR